MMVQRTASHDIPSNGIDGAVSSRTILRLTNTSSVTLVLAIDVEGSEECMGVRNRGEAENGGKELHGERFKR